MLPAVLEDATASTTQYWLLSEEPMIIGADVKIPLGIENVLSMYLIGDTQAAGVAEVKETYAHASTFPLLHLR